MNISFAVLVILISALTFFFRFALLNHGGQKLLKPQMSQFLSLLAPATFAALTMNSLLPHGQEDPQLFGARIAAGTLAMLVAILTKNLILTIFVGLGGLYLLTHFILA